MAETDSTTVPTWARVVGVFDLETTGVDVRRDRIVTAHVGVLDATGAVISSRSWLADPGIPIPAQASAIHGITTERAQRHGQRAHSVVEEVTAELASLFERGIPVVAYNANYDFSLLLAECLRHGIAPITSPSPVIDPLVIDKALDRYRPGKRQLSYVAAHYGVPLEDAHDAAADAHAAGRVAQAIARRFDQVVPESALELHTRQIAWARAQAASLTDYFIRIGRLEADQSLDGSWPLREMSHENVW